MAIAIAIDSLYREEIKENYLCIGNRYGSCWLDIKSCYVSVPLLEYGHTRDKNST